MTRYGVVVLLIVMMAATAILAGACGTQSGGTQQVGKMQRDSQSVDLKNARSTRAQLKMGAGELNITGGADQLMEGEFSYNVSYGFRIDTPVLLCGMRPPVVERVRADEVGLLKERYAAFDQRFFEPIKILEQAIGYRFVCQRPQPLGGL